VTVFGIMGKKLDYKIWIENIYIIILMESARISFLPKSSFVNNITEPVVFGPL